MAILRPSLRLDLLLGRAAAAAAAEPRGVRSAATASAASASAAADGRGAGTTSRELLRMRVKAADVNIARLGGGVLARMKSRLPTQMDAIGDASVSNAVKALAMANTFAEKEASAPVAFVPLLVRDDGAGAADEGKGGGQQEERRLVRLEVQPAPRSPSEGPSPAQSYSEDDDFASGGIYVPVDASVAGARGAITSSIRRGGGSNAGAPASTNRGGGVDGGGARRVATPTELARTVLGEWMRFAAPAVRYTARAAAAGEEPAAAAAGGAPRGKVGRQRPPFLVTMGPPALSRAVKALAFAHGDLAKEERFKDVPSFVVVPHYRLRHKTDKFNGKETTTRLVVLCLERPPPPPEDGPLA